MISSYSFDVVVIGAGAIGLSVGAALAPHCSVLILEAESSIGTHTSSRNSEVIHSGIYYKEGSLKSDLCISGNHSLYDFLKKYNIDHRKCGKYIVAAEGEEHQAHILHNKAKKLGITSRIVTGKKVAQDEPMVRCSEALYIPSTGILDSHAFMMAQKSIVDKNDGLVCFGYKVDHIREDAQGYILFASDEEYGIRARVVINAAGLFSDRIASMLSYKVPKISFYKGEYFKAGQIKGIQRLIYAVPPEDGLSLGIHTRNYLDGQISFGPNVYPVDDVDYSVDTGNAKDFAEAINKYFNVFLKEADLTPDYAGIRPKIGEGKTSTDFYIRDDGEESPFVNLIGIESPGLTCSIEIAKRVLNMIKDRL